MGKTKGKNVIVTGAGGGIGLDAAKRFLAEGSKVLIVDLRTGNAEADPELAEAIQEKRVFFQSADVTNEESVKAYNEKALELFGRVDVVVLAAGVCHDLTDWVDVSEKTYDFQMSVNVRGVWLGIKYGAIAMLNKPRGDNQGAFVLLSSMAALAGRPRLSAYSTSKWAVRGLGQVAASEFGPLGIRTNVVHPAATLTPMVQATFTPEAQKKMEGRIAIGRLARPDEMSSVIVFLASDKAKYINGDTIAVHAAIANQG